MTKKQTCIYCEETKIVARGMCSRHYNKWRYQNIRTRVCIVPECNTWQNSSTGYCGFHYTSLRILGDPLARGMAGDFCRYGHQGQYVQRKSGRVCGECLRIRDRERSKTEKRQRQSKNYRLTTMFKMTLEEFESKIQVQDGKCAICEDILVGGRNGASVDHDHACCPGKKSCGRCLRDILCGCCNKTLGLARDDIGRLLACVSYLKRWREVPN